VSENRGFSPPAMAKFVSSNFNREDDDYAVNNVFKTIQYQEV
jgi:hypothetical protein